jgi:enamine deaminase RidA (YjgF/YER057c/UK114 family)
MSVEERLSELGITLPEPPSPVGSYIPVLRTGNLLYLSGILPFRGGVLTAKGIVGRDVDPETAREAASQVVVNALAVVRSIVPLDSIRRCVRMNGYVASDVNFHDQPGLSNAPPDLLREILGERGIHTRIAVGVAVLPMNAPVEMDFIFEVD